MAKKQAASLLEVFGQLREMITLLPTQDQQSGMVEALHRISELMDRVAQAVQMLPTREEILESQIPQSLDQITSFFQSIDAAGKASSVTGKRGGQARRVTDPETILQQLQRVPSDQVENTLRDFVPTVTVLKDVLARLGASPRGASKKEDLIRRVADEIRTRRNLSGLRDGATP